MPVQVSVAECLLRDSRKRIPQENFAVTAGCKTSVLPYIHNVSHNLKKVAQRANIRVVFSAPDKLDRLCKLTNPKKDALPVCGKRHVNKYVDCTRAVVYKFPLSCNSVYIGQTGRCINDRLREHNYNANNKISSSGFLAIHCKSCGCKPLLDRCIIIGRSHNQVTREIIEADAILKCEKLCVSTPSLALSSKEREFLRLSTQVQ